MTAPCAFDGPINGSAFGACVQQVLVPVQLVDIVWTISARTKSPALLRRSRPPAHKCVIYRLTAPTNPIEQVFAKFKTLLRKTAARTIEAL